ncbi:MAG: DinB family protein [Dehalococcoidia bacterium]|nr:DinB family protein [Dehalococcoidia bacterium]
MGNVRHNFLSILCGRASTRDRDSEFAAMGESVAGIEAGWNDLQRRISEAIQELPPDDLDRVRDDPQRGKITGRELMVIVASHAAEHYGQAQLTRDLVKSRHSG